MRRLAAFLEARPFLYVLVAALLVRIIWFSIAEVGLCFQRPKPKANLRTPDGRAYMHTPVQAVDMWTRFDGDFYLVIASEGYDHPPAYAPAAFFPVYPLAIRAVSSLTGAGELGVGLVIANLCDLGAWLLLLALARRRLTDHAALLSLGLFALFPTRQFGFSLYAEGPFLLLAVGAFLAYERRRYGLATVLGIIVSATRPQGVCVGMALLADAAVARWLRREKNAPSSWQVALLAASPAGLVGYMIYLWQRFDSPLLFIEAQQVWDRQLSTPLRTLLRFDADPHVYVIAVGGLTLVVAMARSRWPVRDWVLCGLALGAPLFSGSLQGYARYGGILFPLFVFAADRIVGRPRIRWAYAAIACVYTIVFAFKVGQWAVVT